MFEGLDQTFVEVKGATLREWLIWDPSNTQAYQFRAMA